MRRANGARTRLPARPPEFPEGRVTRPRRADAPGRAAGGAAAPASASPETAVILIFLSGGPAQLDTFDPKPDAPEEFRGPFASIPTALPGVRVTELFPQVARLMDRMTVLRSIHHTTGSHHEGYHWMMTGANLEGGRLGANQRPAMGAVAARFRGPNRQGMPAYAGMPRATGYGGPAYLGVGYGPFEVPDPNEAKFQVPNLKLAAGVDAGKLTERKELLRSFDGMRRDLDTRGNAAALDGFQREAFDLVLGPAARAAFDMGKESTRLRDRYGRTRIGQCCLMARRLVEAGVTFVAYEDYETCEWDLHGPAGNDPFGVNKGTRIKGAHLDRALSALVEDLEDRGLLDRTLVLAVGEFGRTPKVNGGGGRRPLPVRVPGAAGRRRPAPRACGRGEHGEGRVPARPPAHARRRAGDRVPRPRHRPEDRPGRRDRAPDPAAERGRGDPRADLIPEQAEAFGPLPFLALSPCGRGWRVFEPGEG